MDALYVPGRYLYAAAITAFGIEQLIFHHTLTTLIPLPDSTPGYLFWIYATSALFIAAGICLIAKIRIRAVATLLGLFFILLYLLFYLPKEISLPKDPGSWTAAFELLAIGGGAFILARIQTPKHPGEKWNFTVVDLNSSGIYLFASAFVIIGIQHFLYAEFIATLIPGWLPAKLFWAYFIGVAFFAIAVSLFFGIKVKLAAIFGGIMFLTWVVILHAPRVAANPATETEWTSLFIAMGMGGICFVIAGGRK